MKRGLLLVLASGAVCASSAAAAAELELPGGSVRLETHGFVSQGFLLTTANNYLANTSRGSFEFSEIGLNFTLPATEKLRLGVQLFSRQLGPIGDYKATLDWYYLDYHWKDWLGLRAGRVKLPFGLYNDSSDVDSARTAILLPQSIYPAQNRDFLLAQTGGELYGYTQLGAPGALEYQLYAGTIFIEVTPQPTSPITLVSLEVPYVAGGRLLWAPPLDGLRLGASLQFLRLDTNLLTPQKNTVSFKIPATLWVASAEYLIRDWQFAAEYSRWLVKGESSDPAFIPNSSTTSERAYALASYRVNPLLAAGVYYSVYFPNVDKRTRREDYQHDVALTVRFDVNSYWLIKIEGHYLRGTASLAPTLNGNQPLSELDPKWALFAVKTTAFF